MKKDMGSKESVADELFNKIYAKNLFFIVKEYIYCKKLAQN